MKIIIIDEKSESSQELFLLLSSVTNKADICVVSNFQSFYEIYSNNISMVFITSYNEISIQEIKKITQINPLQKIVIINNSLECSKMLSCQECKDKMNIYRIFRPLNIKDIIKVIKNEKCEIDYCNGTELSKLHIISKTLNYFFFQEETYQFRTSSNYKNILQNPNFLDLLNILKMNDIQYFVDENFVQIESV